MYRWRTVNERDKGNMALKFKKKESVRQGVRRLGRRQIDAALGALEDCKKLEAVHEVRKHIKRLRALLRLVRSAIVPSVYRSYSDRLREAAGYLGPARDAHVKLNALVELVGHFKQELAPRSFREIKTLLSADCRNERAALSQTRASSRVARLLKGLRGPFASLKLNASGWSALASGLKRSYRNGRQGYQLVRKDGTPEHFHQWRKRVKDLYYQIGLLASIWPEQMAASEAELERLGDCLGDDHDLFMLNEPETAKCFRKQAPKEAEALEALLAERRKELHAQALGLGARFYEEKPSVFCKRMRQYWKRWRREPKRLLRTR